MAWIPKHRNSGIESTPFIIFYQFSDLYRALISESSVGKEFVLVNVVDSQEMACYIPPCFVYRHPDLVHKDRQPFS